NALGKVQAGRFTLGLRGLGLFPPHGEPRVLWVGVETNSALQSLHQTIGELLTNEIGYVPESRPYAPHITLSRFNGPTSRVKLQQHMKNSADFHIAEIPVTQFALYSSTVVDRAPTYTEEAAVLLDDS